MELHVLGPAFGHPSIDAECAAAIALLRLRSLSHPTTPYSIIPSHSPTTTLPTLTSGSKTFHGFNAIASHLYSHQTADTTALLSFLQTHAPPLTNTALYVSAENYRTSTRPAFTAILPWHANFIVPPRRRAAARAATQHLGIAGIDVDDAHEASSNALGRDVGKVPGEGGFEKESRERASLLLPGKQTLRGLLGRGESGAVWRLQALADGVFEPLDGWLGEGEGFSAGAEVGVEDCLAFGYLGLMVRGSAWLRELLGEGGRYRRLGEFVERVERRLELRTRVEDVVELTKCKSREDVEGRRKALGMILPWMPPVKPNLLETGSDIVTELWRHVPYLGPSATTVVPICESPRPWYSWHLQTLFLTATASVALAGCWAFSRGLLIWPHGEYVQVFGRKRLSDYGHLGAALSGLSLLGRQSGRNEEYQDETRIDEGIGKVGVVVEEVGTGP